MAIKVQSFSDLNLNKQILSAVKERGYDKPTEIQQRAIPAIQSGHDVIGIAQTGTGKTAAYVLPIIMKLKYHQGNDPRALILSPTRELAIQIAEEVEKFCANLDLKTARLYGGTGLKLQKEQLESGADILIATPGRFMDLYLEGFIYTKYIKTMVLDEADKMMDMGFMPQIRNILEVIPTKRQNLLFSATMAEKVLTLSEEFLEFPMTIEITPQATTVPEIGQILYKVPNFKTKINLLGVLLKNNDFSRVILFTKTKANANNIFKFINRKITDSVRLIHGNKDQNTRINAYRDFQDGEINILVCTDVVARGIDIAEVSHVINFDVPLVYEDYVHRIGRTGRAKKSGKAITFVNEAEQYHIQQIETLINQQIKVVKLPVGLKVEPTSFEEQQIMAREIDYQKRKEDESYSGAFHAKKNIGTKSKRNHR